MMPHHALRLRARLRRNSQHGLPLYDRNGNNLLMIAPGTNSTFKRHIMFLDMTNRRIKIEQDEKEKDEEKDAQKPPKD